MKSDQVAAVGFFGLIAIIILGFAFSDLVSRQGQNVQLAGVEATSTQQSENAEEAAAEVKITNGSADSATSETENAVEEEAERASSNGLGPNPVVPNYDIIRVEPSGEAVFAGQGEPGWVMEIRREGEVIGSTKVDNGGDWVIVTDEPLPAGPTDVTLQATSPDGVMTVNAPDTVTVSIDEQKEETPLVLLQSPNASTEVVQIPPAGEAQTAQDEDAGSDTGATGGGAQDSIETAQEPQSDEASDGSSADSVSAADTAAGTAGSAQTQAELSQAASGDDQSKAGQSNGSQTDEASSQLTQAGSVLAGTEETGTEGAQTAPSSQQQAASGATATENVTADASTPATASSDQASAGETNDSAAELEQPAVSIEAVEADTQGQLFVSGAGEVGETVRVYAGNKLVGDAKVEEDGSWSIRAEKDLAQGENAIRVDALGDGEDATPTARAEVTFDRPDLDKPIIAFAPLPTSRAQPVTASANRLVVQKGDNLWNIAREIYGEGVRFSVIYQANTRQIRNPDLIFPGQVFAVPNNPRFGATSTISN